jgi:hypothetical protein
MLLEMFPCPQSRAVVVLDKSLAKLFGKALPMMRQ